MNKEISNFAELGLSPTLLKTIEQAGYTEPTLVQKLAIPAILKKQDVIVMSQTGSGKTAAFALPLISLLEEGYAKARLPRSLILSPTRELAMQISENLKLFSKKINIATLIGGESIEKQNRILGKNIDIVIATPGRLLDHVKRGTIMLKAIETLILDEADRMLDMGFSSDIESLMSHLLTKPLTLLFSATMAPAIEKLSRKYLENPVRIEATKQSSIAQTITQNWIKTTSDIEKKKHLLLDLLNAEKTNIVNAIIFCNRKLDSSKMQKWLSQQGFNAAALHGDIHQNARSRILRDFKKGKYQLLVATDIAARGLDVKDIGYVFNFDLPRNKEDYIHRIGRTGRAGREGKAFNIVSKTDMSKAREIEKLTKKKITWLEPMFKPANFAQVS